MGVASGWTGNLATKYLGATTGAAPIFIGPPNRNVGSITQDIGSPAQFFALGGMTNEATTVEANCKSSIPYAGTLSLLSVSCKSNSNTSAKLYTSRKNGSAGNLSVSVTASTTGVFRDTTHNDSLVQGDQVAVQSASGGSGSVTQSINGITLLFTATQPAAAPYAPFRRNQFYLEI